ncbi:VanZ family protein, partial [Escherichia coli]
ALSRHPLPRARRILLAALACVIYAVLDEAHQSLVPERSFTLLDILLDTGGSLLGMALSFLVPSARRAGG